MYSFKGRILPTKPTRVAAPSPRTSLGRRRNLSCVGCTHALVLVVFADIALVIESELPRPLEGSAPQGIPKGGPIVKHYVVPLKDPALA